MKSTKQDTQSDALVDQVDEERSEHVKSVESVPGDRMDISEDGYKPSDHYEREIDSESESESSPSNKKWNPFQSHRELLRKEKTDKVPSIAFFCVRVFIRNRFCQGG